MRFLRGILLAILFFVVIATAFGQDYSIEIVYFDRIICLKSSINELGADYILVYSYNRILKIELHHINYDLIPIVSDANNRPYVVFRKAPDGVSRSIVSIHVRNGQDIEFD